MKIKCVAGSWGVGADKYGNNLWVVVVRGFVPVKYLPVAQVHPQVHLDKRE